MARAPKLRIEQSEKFEGVDGEDWWSWSVWIDGPPQELRQVKFAEYTLHPTFPEPVQIRNNPRNKFKLSTSGWGVFPIHVRIVRKDGSEARLRHKLKLHYPSGRLNKS